MDGAGEFIYLLAEGVTDVTLIERVLKRTFGMKELKTRDALNERSPMAAKWLAGFKWPWGEDKDISRRAVPAPVFCARDGAPLVAIRNGKGIKNLNNTLDADHEAFDRFDWTPVALGVFVDADTKDPQQRFETYKKALTPENSHSPRSSFPSLEELTKPAEVRRDAEGRAAGLFVFSNDRESGTLEDLLLGLGGHAFRELYEHCESCEQGWWKRREEWLARLPVDADHDKALEKLAEWEELSKPAGRAKARLSMMAAVLKPGKNLHATLRDHHWVPENPQPDDAASKLLEPLVGFLEGLGLERLQR